MRHPIASTLRRCLSKETHRVQAVINAGAEAYRGVIPSDCWHDPYMTKRELEREIADGVEFWGAYRNDELLGVMGIQAVQGEVALIRHAYLDPRWQRQGIGAALLTEVRSMSERPFLIGTWKAASWAIAFYEKHGFQVVPAEDTPILLERYWSVPQRQAEESVVLGDGRWFDVGA